MLKIVEDFHHFPFQQLRLVAASFSSYTVRKGLKSTPEAELEASGGEVDEHGVPWMFFGEV